MNLQDQTNDDILCTIGAGLERLRTDAQLPDAEVMRRGGIRKDAWYSLKSGGNVTLMNLVRALRGLGRLDLLTPLAARDEEPAPMSLATGTRPAGRKRFGRSGDASGAADAPDAAAEVFPWGDRK